jgi:hypothetical protein
MKTIALILFVAVLQVTSNPIEKRQLALPFPDYYTALLDYAAYDYYDWVCTGNKCQLCDILTGQCCNPNQPNCFLPDSCANNPCLTGGTCIPTKTIAGQPDFTCVCKSGLTGKYCQLRDDFAGPILPAPGMPFGNVLPGK